MYDAAYEKSLTPAQWLEWAFEQGMDNYYHLTGRNIQRTVVPFYCSFHQRYEVTNHTWDEEEYAVEEARRRVEAGLEEEPIEYDEDEYR